MARVNNGSGTQRVLRPANETFSPLEQQTGAPPVMPPPVEEPVEDYSPLEQQTGAPPVAPAPIPEPPQVPEPIVPDAPEAPLPSTVATTSLTPEQQEASARWKAENPPTADPAVNAAAYAAWLSSNPYKTPAETNELVLLNTFGERVYNAGERVGNTTQAISEAEINTLLGKFYWTDADGNRRESVYLPKSAVEQLYKDFSDNPSAALPVLIQIGVLPEGTQVLSNVQMFNEQYGTSLTSPYLTPVMVALVDAYNKGYVVADESGNATLTSVGVRAAAADPDTLNGLVALGFDLDSVARLVQYASALDFLMVNNLADADGNVYGDAFMSSDPNVLQALRGVGFTDAQIRSQQSYVGVLEGSQEAVRQTQEDFFVSQVPEELQEAYREGLRTSNWSRYDSMVSSMGAQQQREAVDQYITLSRVGFDESAQRSVTETLATLRDSGYEVDPEYPQGGRPFESFADGSYKPTYDVAYALREGFSQQALLEAFGSSAVAQALQYNKDVDQIAKYDGNIDELVRYGSPADKAAAIRLYGADTIDEADPLKTWLYDGKYITYAERGEILVDYERRRDEALQLGQIDRIMSDKWFAFEGGSPADNMQYVGESAGDLALGLPGKIVHLANQPTPQLASIAGDNKKAAAFLSVFDNLKQTALGWTSVIVGYGVFGLPAFAVSAYRNPNPAEMARTLAAQVIRDVRVVASSAVSTTQGKPVNFTELGKSIGMIQIMAEMANGLVAKAIVYLHPRGMPLSAIAKEYSTGRVPIKDVDPVALGKAMETALKEVMNPNMRGAVDIPVGNTGLSLRILKPEVQQLLGDMVWHGAQEGLGFATRGAGRTLVVGEGGLYTNPYAAVNYTQGGSRPVFLLIQTAAGNIKPVSARRLANINQSDFFIRTANEGIYAPSKVYRGKFETELVAAPGTKVVVPPSKADLPTRLLLGGEADFFTSFRGTFIPIKLGIDAALVERGLSVRNITKADLLAIKLLSIRSTLQNFAEALRNPKLTIKDFMTGRVGPKGVREFRLTGKNLDAAAKSLKARADEILRGSDLRGLSGSRLRATLASALQAAFDEQVSEMLVSRPELTSAYSEPALRDKFEDLYRQNLTDAWSAYTRTVLELSGMATSAISAETRERVSSPTITSPVSSPVSSPASSAETPMSSLSSPVSSPTSTVTSPVSSPVSTITSPVSSPVSSPASSPEMPTSTISTPTSTTTRPSSGPRTPGYRRDGRPTDDTIRKGLPFSGSPAGRRVNLIPPGSIAWAQGAVWKYIPPEDFGTATKPRTLREPPKGARNVSSNRPEETIQVIGRSRKGVPNSVAVDMGTVDVFISGGGTAIRFEAKGTETNVGTRIASTTQGMEVNQTAATPPVRYVSTSRRRPVSTTRARSRYNATLTAIRR